MQTVSRCNKRTGLYGPANNLDSFTASRAENANFEKFEAIGNNGTAFAQKQCIQQKVAAGMENPKMQSPSRCNKRTGRYGPANNPDSFTASKAENANFGKLEAVGNDGTAFAPKQSLCEELAVGMDNPKMQSLFRCNKLAGRYSPANNTDSFISYRADNANLGKFEAVENSSTAFAPKQRLYQKLAVGMENR